MKKSTDVATVTAQETGLATAYGLFRDIDFNGLNSVIDKIGDSSATMTPEEKVSATAIVEDWQKNVVDRMYNYNNKMMNLINMLSVTTEYRQWLNGSGGALSAQQIEQLVMSTETTALYDEAKQLYEDWEFYSEEKHPENPYIDTNMSTNEIAKKKRMYEMELSTFRIEQVKKERKIALSFQKFIKAIKSHKSVKDMLATAKTYTAGLNDNISECKSKTTMAKLNIQISSPEVRAAIRELLSFTSKV